MGVSAWLATIMSRASRHARRVTPWCGGGGCATLDDRCYVSDAVALRQHAL
jgi:hypothetical protein